MNARHYFPVARSATLFLGAVSLSLGCQRLPDTIPYEARILNKDDGATKFRVGELHDADLLLDGRKVARLDAKRSGAIAFGQWSSPKSELRSVMTGKYAVSLDGPCGPFSLSAGSPSSGWASKSDREIARIVAKDGAMPIFLEVDLPKTHRLLVDRGSSTGTLRVGNLVVDPGKNMVSVSLPGCTAAPTVTLDGSPLGTLDLGAKANLITLEPGVCHVHQEVIYGDEEPTRPPLKLPANGVAALSEEPIHFLTPAPSSARLPKSMKGSLSSELLRSGCTDTKDGVLGKFVPTPEAGNNSNRDSTVAPPIKKAAGPGKTASSGLPAEVVQRIVRQNFGRFRLCYEKGLQNNPKLEGRVSVKVTVGPSGAVSSAADNGSNLPDPDFVACVVRGFKSLSFPQPEGGKEAFFVYPIAFAPGSN